MLTPTLEISYSELEGHPTIVGSLIWTATEGERIDRPTTLSWAFSDKPKNRKLVARWKEAIDSGAATRNPVLVEDKDKNTYVKNEWVGCIYPMGKHLAKHVAKLGF